MCEMATPMVCCDGHFGRTGGSRGYWRGRHEACRGLFGAKSRRNCATVAELRCSTMSVPVHFRMPDVLHARLAKEAASRNVSLSQMILSRLDAPSHPPESGHQLAPPLSEVRSIIGKVPNVTTAVQLPARAKPSDRCPRCDHPLIAWGSQQRCVNCARNYELAPAAPAAPTPQKTAS